MKIGVVDLDTSHPANWIPIERDLGHEVVGVWDGGSVHPVEYVRDFAKEHEIPTVYDSLEQMVGEVDCAIIHGCNWDTHIAKARPFVESGKAVLIDKPVAGNVRDLKQLCRWAGEGARITGGNFAGGPVKVRGLRAARRCDSAARRGIGWPSRRRSVASRTRCIVVVGPMSSTTRSMLGLCCAAFWVRGFEVFVILVAGCSGGFR